MAGIKQFDHGTVVDRAMMLFWRKGYGRTSIQDLENATRLRRGSLYNAFGDKQGLFVAALKRYETTVPNAPDQVLRIIAERTAGIEGAIYGVLRRAQAEGLLDPAADARAVARFYLGIAKGITVLHKVFGDASALRDIVKIAMSKWPYPERKRASASKRDLGS